MEGKGMIPQRRAGSGWLTGPSLEVDSESSLHNCGKGVPFLFTEQLEGATC